MEAAQTVTLTVTVTDTEGASNSASVEVTVQALAENEPPRVTVAQPPEVVVSGGAQVTLDGTATDPDGEDQALTYEWTSLTAEPSPLPPRLTPPGRHPTARTAPSSSRSS